MSSVVSAALATSSSGLGNWANASTTFSVGTNMSVAHSAKPPRAGRKLFIASPAILLNVFSNISSLACVVPNAR